MLSLAIKARIPILRARTTDLLNLPDVLHHIAPHLDIAEAKHGAIPMKAHLVYAVEEIEIQRSHYDSLIEEQRILLLINQGEESPFAFDVGEVPIPRELMVDLLTQVISEKKVPELLPCFNGLTLKGMAEVIRLTTARDKALTARGVAQIRANITGKLQGLGQVETELPFYLCPQSLGDWIAKNKKYFLEAKDQRLVPKGILLNGDPGVGKSQGAKHIANEFGVPLYRLDLSSALGKWVGESESNFARVLNTLDQEEPCCLLVDEVEKIFSESEDQGVTSRLLSQLLWWLAEHKSRILTVMTTNNLEALPKELYRARRIDKVITIEKLSYEGATALAVAALEQFLKPEKKHKVLLTSRLSSLSHYKTKKYVPLSHAEIVQGVIDLIKELNWIS